MAEQRSVSTPVTRDERDAPSQESTQERDLTVLPTLPPWRDGSNRGAPVEGCDLCSDPGRASRGSGRSPSTNGGRVRQRSSDDDCDRDPYGNAEGDQQHEYHREVMSPMAKRERSGSSASSSRKSSVAGRTMSDMAGRVKDKTSMRAKRVSEMLTTVAGVPVPNVRAPRMRGVT